MTTMTREQRRARTLDDPRFERFRNPRSRRLLAGGMLATLLTEGAVMALTDTDLPRWMVLAGIAVVIVAGVFLLGALKASTRGLEELSEGVLDERQAQLRGRVYASAYRLGAGLFVVGLATVALWLLLGWAAPGSGIVLAALVVSFHTAIVLPTLVAALRTEV
jgi:hypothetical protein